MKICVVHIENRGRTAAVVLMGDISKRVIVNEIDLDISVVLSHKQRGIGFDRFVVDKEKT